MQGTVLVFKNEENKIGELPKERGVFYVYIQMFWCVVSVRCYQIRISFVMSEKNRSSFNKTGSMENVQEAGYSFCLVVAIK
ncbi:MAG: hypothetical protein K0Q79_1075 [Flavipsychrobacter sp.]|jgi:hypothetical protein|nr:hypothetical protein [Flavipsychrobacter sp.]